MLTRYLHLTVLGVLLSAPLAWSQPLAGGQPLATTTVSATPVPISLTAYGTVHARETAVLAAKLLARVDALPARAGDTVSKGDLLVQLDHADIDARMAVARAALARNEAALAEAKGEFKRVTGLFDRGSATRRELDRATSGHLQALGAHTQAQAQVALTQTDLSYTQILAPFDGRLVKRLKEVGEMATPGTPLVQVAAATHLEMWVDIPQSDRAQMVLNAIGEVIVDGFDTPLTGRVVRIIPAADPRSHTFTAKLALDMAADNSLIFPGMSGHAKIHYDTETMLTVALDALSKRAEVTGVYVIGDNPNKPVFRLVRAGRRLGDRVVIESGLVAGERIAADAASAARYISMVTP